MALPSQRGGAGACIGAFFDGCAPRCNGRAGCAGTCDTFEPDRERVLHLEPIANYSTFLVA